MRDLILREPDPLAQRELIMALKGIGFCRTIHLIPEQYRVGSSMIFSKS